MFEKPRIALPAIVLLFFMPLSIFVIGDYVAIGLRFPLFRIQWVFQSVTFPDGEVRTYVTSSIITIVRELEFISLGFVGSALGRTAVATYIWVAGLVLLAGAAALVVSWQVYGNPGHARYPGPLIIAAGALFLLWAMVQFGPFFSGPVGYTIPVGIPLVWYLGYRFMKDAEGADEGEAGED